MTKTALQIVRSLFCLAAAVAAADCAAGTIANLVVSNLSSPTVFVDDPATGIKRETQSSAMLTASNLAAPMPTFSARLAGMAAADTELPAPTQSASILLRMQISFDIVALPTEPWSIDISQSRNFALTLAADPPTDGFQSQAIVDLHSASYSLSPGGAGSLQFPTTGSESTPATFGNLDIPINQGALDTLSGIGPTSVLLNFEQRLAAHSFANSDPNITVLAPGQEAAVRFGMLGTLTDVSAYDYPGPGNRVLVNDGHFVNIKVTFIPEPTAAGLACWGAMLLASVALRRRPRSA